MIRLNLQCAMTVLLLAWVSVVTATEWYQVEVIAFRYPIEGDSSWVSAPTLPDFGGALRLREPENPEQTDVSTMYAALAPHELQLAGAYKRLQGSSKYQVLFHTGWRQAPGDSRPVYLTDRNIEAVEELPEVEGVIRLVTDGKAMQVRSDFVVRMPESVVAISESRPVTDAELHYLDHPLLGLIVQVTHHTDDPIEAEALPLEPSVERD
jgi:Peptidoglycan-binding protein, CsiV